MVVLMDVRRRNAAGKSAERQFQTLYMQWKRRRFGTRRPLLLRTGLILSFLLVLSLHLGRSWSLIVGVLYGGIFVGWMLFPQLFVPRRIFNWQMGAWGEQKTASELKRLQKQGWVVRHDAAWGDRSNHDHVLAGPAVFLINSKNTPDSAVAIEAESLRVTSIDVTDGGYLADRWIPAAVEKWVRELPSAGAGEKPSLISRLFAP
jgi:hypothetical protein